MPSFVAGLLDFWASEHSDRLIAMSKSQPDPSLRVAALIDIAVDLPHASEAAIRAWGRSNADVAEVTLRVDRRRERHLTDAIVALGIDRASAKLLARMALNLLIGTQQREQPVDLKRLRSMFEELQQADLSRGRPRAGRAPDQRHLGLTTSGRALGLPIGGCGIATTGALTFGASCIDALRGRRTDVCHREGLERVHIPRHRTHGLSSATACS